MNCKDKNYIPQDLYNHIRKLMPRSCVDILVINDNKSLVVTRAANDTEPLVSWIPGGRLFMHESQIEGCYRILEQECYLSCEDISVPQLLGNLSFSSDHPKGFRYHDASSIYQCSLTSASTCLVSTSSHHWIDIPHICSRPGGLNHSASSREDYIGYSVYSSF